MSKDLTVKSVALGKAHLLILTTGGMVITSGFSNKGQCGLGSIPVPSGATTNQSSVQTVKQQMILNFDEPPPTTSAPITSQTSLNVNCATNYLSHLFVYGKTRKCTSCFSCTEFGTKCSNSSKPVQTKTTEIENVCGCGEGNSGCTYCGICADCSKVVPFCKRYVIQ